MAQAEKPRFIVVGGGLAGLMTVIKICEAGYECDVFSFVPCFTPFLAPAAIVLGILGLQECKRDPHLPGKGHAITGIVLGSITFLFALAIVLVVVLFGRPSNPNSI